MSIIENLLVGIISGCLSSIIVTQIYRKIDQKRDRYEYLNELITFSYEFQKALFFIGGTNIQDEYIIQLSEFVTKNTLPIKKQWIRLTIKENEICNDFIGFYNDSINKILKCKLNIQRVHKGESKYVSDVEADKLQISNNMQLQATDYWMKILDLRNSYSK